MKNGDVGGLGVRGNKTSKEISSGRVCMSDVGKEGRQVVRKDERVRLEGRSNMRQSGNKVKI